MPLRGSSTFSRCVHDHFLSPLCIKFPSFSIEINHTMKMTNRPPFFWLAGIFSFFSYTVSVLFGFDTVKMEWYVYWFSYCCKGSYCLCSHVLMSHTRYSNQCIFRFNDVFFIHIFCINKSMISFQHNWNWI